MSNDDWMFSLEQARSQLPTIQPSSGSGTASATER